MIYLPSCKRTAMGVYCNKIERKAKIRNRYNYPTPPIRDIKGKETQTRNNWTLMETSLAESQTDIYSYKVAKFLSKTKRCKRHTHSKTNYKKNKPWQKNRLGTVSEKYFTGWGRGEGLKSILRGHNPRPYFCRALDTYFVQSAWRLPNSLVLQSLIVPKIQSFG